MGGWYRVVKTIKGNRYVYLQQTFREDGQVRTRNRYLGRAEERQKPSSKSHHLPASAGSGGRPPAEELELTLPPHRRITDAYPPTFLGMDMAVLEKKAMDAGYNLYDALIKRVDSQDELEKRIWAIHDIWGEILGLLAQKEVKGAGQDADVLATTTTKASVSSVPKQYAPTDIPKELAAFAEKAGEYASLADFSGDYLTILDNPQYRQFGLRTLNKHGFASLAAFYEASVSSRGAETPEEAEAERSVTTTHDRSSPVPPGLPNRQIHSSALPPPGSVPRDVQAEITATIIAAIESGVDTGTFQMPWHAIAAAGVPVNSVTHQPYHGINRLLLSFEAQERKWPNSWASFQQWRQKGASVRRGEHGVPIVFYTPVAIEGVEKDAQTGEEKAVVRTIPVLRYSTVFNISQVDNPPQDASQPALPPVNPIIKAEQFIAATKADIRYGGDKAYFSPSEDFIRIPEAGAFIGSKTSSPTEAFYATVLHELCHWTGGEKRLNRQMGKRFGDEAYAAEELVAEIGASFASASLSIAPELRADHVQYVASWLKILKEDKRAIFTAASEGSRAVEFLEGLQTQEKTS